MPAHPMSIGATIWRMMSYPPAALAFAGSAMLYSTPSGLVKVWNEIPVSPSVVGTESCAWATVLTLVSPYELCKMRVIVVIMTYRRPAGKQCLLRQCSAS